jgi:hypothetical protein
MRLTDCGCAASYIGRSTEDELISREITVADHHQEDYMPPLLTQIAMLPPHQ